MGTEWAVVATADQLTLDAHNTGDMTFMVSNPGTVADAVVFDILPGEGSLRSWFTVKEPQRTVKPNEAVSYRVKVSVPPGTPAGRYDLKGMAYSASAAPEESSRTSGRVSFEVGVVQAAASKPWPILIAAAVLVLLVIGVAFFVLMPSDKTDAELTAGTGPTPTPSASPSPLVLVGTPYRVGPSAAAKKTSAAPSIPKVSGTYRGTTVRKSNNDTSQVRITLTQEGTKLSGSLKELKYPDNNYLGSGTVNANGDVTLRFEIGVTVIMEGKLIGPGRLKGTYRGESSSETTGTWDVCTCIH